MPYLYMYLSNYLLLLNSKSVIYFIAIRLSYWWSFTKVRDTCCYAMATPTVWNIFTRPPSLLSHISKCMWAYTYIHIRKYIKHFHIFQRSKIHLLPSLNWTTKASFTDECCLRKLFSYFFLLLLHGIQQTNVLWFALFHYASVFCMECNKTKRTNKQKQK